MDWSLVLVSQGIETFIERDPETERWQLAVHWPDQERALHAIRQYRAENQRQLWRHTLPWTGLIFDWRSGLWFFLLVVIFAFEETRSGFLRSAGAMHNESVWSGQWWRLFTAVTLHGDISHLVSNVTTGILLLGLAMGSYGPGLAVLAAFLAGAGGNLAGLMFYPAGHRGLGASGMIMGALGMLAVQSLAVLPLANPKQLTVRGLGGGVLLLVLLGTSPGTDVLAHVAGFISGCVLGGLLLLVPARNLQSGWANRGAELLCAALVLWTWWLALR